MKLIDDKPKFTFASLSINPRTVNLTPHRVSSQISKLMTNNLFYFNVIILSLTTGTVYDLNTLNKDNLTKLMNGLSNKIAQEVGRVAAIEEDKYNEERSIISNLYTLPSISYLRQIPTVLLEVHPSWSVEELTTVIERSKNERFVRGYAIKYGSTNKLKEQMAIISKNAPGSYLIRGQSSCHWGA